MTLPLNRTSILFRLSLADLEGDAVSHGTMSGESTSDDVVAKSCDVTICKSVDLTESPKASLDPTNYSFSAYDDVFDESAASLCNTSSKSHDATTGSHDLFDSFDELLQNLTSQITMISKNSMTRKVMSLLVHTT